MFVKAHEMLTENVSSPWTIKSSIVTNGIEIDSEPAGISAVVGAEENRVSPEVPPVTEN